MAGMDHRTVWRFTGTVLGQVFSPCPLLCYVSGSRQCFTQFGRFPQLQFITVVDDAFALCSLSLSASRVAKRHALLGPFLEVQFLDKLFSPVVVQRQVPFLSGQCAALPVEAPQVQFLDEVLVITTNAVV